MRYVLCLIIIVLVSCKNDDNNTQTETLVTFSFIHNWDETQVTNANFNTIQYTNANGEELSIELLRYLISDITFTNSNGTIIDMGDYKLVDVTNNDLVYTTPQQIPTGTYNVSFTFGFDAQDNQDGIYPDLNAANWNVPNVAMLGSIGGYHYMQLEGKFVNTSSTQIGYAYHAIRAADGSVYPPTIQETAIHVNLGAITINENAAIEVQMNIAQWFKNPNTWDLNVLHSMLMPNYNAQLQMHENGQNVFSLGEIYP